MQDEWRAQDDARTLVEAEKIKSDKGRHKAAIGHAKTQAKALGTVIGGKKPANKPAGAQSNPAAKPIVKPSVKPTIADRKKVQTSSKTAPKGKK